MDFKKVAMEKTALYSRTIDNNPCCFLKHHRSYALKIGLKHYKCYPCCPYPPGETSREEPQCAQSKVCTVESSLDLEKAFDRVPRELL
ncbi:hypothetical protein NECAME_03122 [Necator americanus]|uniref:Uncharacterized protein n=1 Tax=Necator americanus TaxID=51031 RepID=W2T7V8_NECAM|nr:hypothetical protein NECAME_03122 [Necator americanus]ETN77704.1 hypothetical protein NECAME_03122 [Necator americanus]